MMMMIIILSLLILMMVLTLNLILGPLTVPYELSHLPEISQWTLLLSYLKGESLDVRYDGLYRIPLAKYGVARVRTQGRWELIVGEIKLAKEILLRHEEFLKRNPDDDQAKLLLVRRMFGLINITISDGEEWRRHRRIINSSFKLNFNLTTPIQNFINHLEDHGYLSSDGFDVLELMRRVTVDIMGLSLFQFNFQAMKLGESHYSVKNYGELLSSLADPIFFAFPNLENWIPSRRYHHRQGEEFRNFIKNMVKDRVNNIDEFQFHQDKDILTKLVLNMLNDQEGEGKEGRLSEEEVIDDLVAIFVAGHDTIANGLTTAIYYLTTHPHLQHKSRQDILSHYDPLTNNSIPPTSDQLKKMTYLDAILLESFRLVPPVGQSRRYCHHPTNLHPHLNIPGRTSISIETFFIHRDPNHFNNPKEFQPDRFLENPKLEQLMLTFGIGTRMCAGRNYALLTTKSILTTLLTRYSLLPTSTLPSPSTITFNTISLVHPENCKIRLERIIR